MLVTMSLFNKSRIFNRVREKLRGFSPPSPPNSAALGYKTREYQVNAVISDIQPSMVVASYFHTGLISYQILINIPSDLQNREHLHLIVYGSMNHMYF